MLKSEGVLKDSKYKSRNSPKLSKVFASGYVNTRNIFYFCYKILEATVFT